MVFKRRLLVVLSSCVALASSYAAVDIQRVSSLAALSSPHWAIADWSGYGLNTPISLVAHQAVEPAMPASITKLLTAYVVMQSIADARPSQQLSLQTKLIVSELATRQEGTRVGYRAGETITVQDALQAMLAISGNDAAWALAEAVSGDTPTFVVRMNEVSKQLKLKHSRWLNPHGLSDSEHLSSASDLMLLAYRLWNDFPAVRPWLSVKQYTWNGVTQSNRNGLLYRDKTVDGLKTGHTTAAGYNLAVTSKLPVRVGDELYHWRLTTVVLGAASAQAREADTTTLLAWARQHYTVSRLRVKGESLGQQWLPDAANSAELRLLESLWVTLPASADLSRVRYTLKTMDAFSSQTAQSAQTAVKAGEQVGHLLAFYNPSIGNNPSANQLVGQAPIYTTQAIERASWWVLTWRRLKSNILFWM